MLRVRCEILRFATSLREVGIGMLLFGNFQESSVISHVPRLRHTCHPVRQGRLIFFFVCLGLHIPAVTNIGFAFFSSTSEKSSSQSDLRGSAAQPRRTSSREFGVCVSNSVVQYVQSSLHAPMHVAVNRASISTLYPLHRDIWGNFCGPKDKSVDWTFRVGPERICERYKTRD